MTPKLRDGATHSYHLYVIRAQRRDELMAHLKEGHWVRVALSNTFAPLAGVFISKTHRE